MKDFKLIENYIYIYQLDKYVIIPTYPEQMNDSLGSTFSSSNPLSRTAPIYSYSNAGPRSIQFDISLHRDMMSQFNYDNISFLDKTVSIDDDYIDTLIRYLQAMALPTFKTAQIQSSISQGKIVNPPVIAVRFGNSVFIKGIVQGNVGVTWSGPIDKNNKYKVATISFTVSETDPQDAETIAKWGSFRGLDTVLSRGLKK